MSTTIYLPDQTIPGMAKDTVGERLRKLREAAGLTLEQAGTVAGTSKQSASQIEKGVTKVPGGLFLYRWSKYYRVNLEWLITGDGDRTDAESATLNPDFLVEAETLVLGQEMALGQSYGKRDRAVRLAHAYAYVAAQGGRVDSATNAVLLDGAQSQSATTGVLESEPRKRGRAKGSARGDR